MRRKRALLVAASAAFVWLRPFLVRIEGSSMMPVLRPGDRLLVSKRVQARLDDVVVARVRDIAMVKRVSAISQTDAVIEGDHKPSTSAVIDRTAIEGVVLARVWPKPARLRR